jgi:hypothetical protein
MDHSSAASLRRRHRLQVRVPGELQVALENCARRSGISVGALARLALEDFMAGAPGTAVDALKRQGPIDQAPALASLWAGEQILRFLDVVFGTHHHVQDTRGIALAAAEERLAELRQRVDGLSS